MMQQNGGKVKNDGGEWISSGMKNSVQQSSSSMKNSVQQQQQKQQGVALSSLVLLHTTPMKIDKAMSLGDVKIYNLYYIL